MSTKPSYAEVASRSPSPTSRSPSPVHIPSTPTPRGKRKDGASNVKAETPRTPKPAKADASPSKRVTKFKADGSTVEVEVDTASDDDSGQDAGVGMDPSDSMYSGRASKNRIEPAAPSIIETRATAARRASSRVRAGEPPASGNSGERSRTQETTRGRKSKASSSKLADVVPPSEVMVEDVPSTSTKSKRHRAQNSVVLSANEDTSDHDASKKRRKRVRLATDTPQHVPSDDEAMPGQLEHCSSDMDAEQGPVAAQLSDDDMSEGEADLSPLTDIDMEEGEVDAVSFSAEQDVELQDAASASSDADADEGDEEGSAYGRGYVEDDAVMSDGENVGEGRESSTGGRASAMSSPPGPHDVPLHDNETVGYDLDDPFIDDGPVAPGQSADFESPTDDEDGDRHHDGPAPANPPSVSEHGEGCGGDDEAVHEASISGDSASYQGSEDEGGSDAASVYALPLTQPRPWKTPGGGPSLRPASSYDEPSSPATAPLLEHQAISTTRPQRNKTPSHPFPIQVPVQSTVKPKPSVSQPSSTAHVTPATSVEVLEAKSSQSTPPANAVSSKSSPASARRVRSTGSSRKDTKSATTADHAPPSTDKQVGRSSRRRKADNKESNEAGSTPDSHAKDPASSRLPTDSVDVPENNRNTESAQSPDGDRRSSSTRTTSQPVDSSPSPHPRRDKSTKSKPLAPPPSSSAPSQDVKPKPIRSKEPSASSAPSATRQVDKSKPTVTSPSAPVPSLNQGTTPTLVSSPPPPPSTPRPKSSRSGASATPTSADQVSTATSAATPAHVSAISLDKKSASKSAAKKRTTSGRGSTSTPDVAASSPAVTSREKKSTSNTTVSSGLSKPDPEQPVSIVSAGKQKASSRTPAARPSKASDPTASVVRGSSRKAASGSSRSGKRSAPVDAVKPPGDSVHEAGEQGESSEPVAGSAVEAGGGSEDAKPPVRSTPVVQKSEAGGGSEDAKPAVSSTPVVQKPNAARSFKSMFKERNPAVPGRALAGAYFNKARTPPETCQVMDEALQDPALKKTYEDLDPVWSGKFQLWTDVAGKGTYSFSNWIDDCPLLDYDSAINAIVFKSHKQFLNPSRASTQSVLVRELPPGTKLQLYTSDRRVAICLSAVQATQSYITEPCPVGVKQKKLHGVFHSQEFERMVGFVCSAFSKELLGAQLGMDEMQFCSKSLFGDGDVPAPRRYSPSKPSPATASASGSTSAPVGDSFSLGIEETIPVYDCTGFVLDLERDLDRLDQLPRWDGEIPRNSFVVVAYTLSVFHGKKGQWKVSFNIRWVMLIGNGEAR
ncbi:hypothetical protein D9611_014179 [Ephemerocybe angulata]|uniref:Uncharacterized protein n=1 Tax=Ephemerocybe angulata TaxID=980116 RepID=A0A8H5FII8_9AGAR|nr:hypothetical protein D9611_014179 [Tulosesus angulatus]